MIGQVVNNFEILRQLGRGGMGAVFEARDRMLDRRVAIKVVRPELGTDDDLRRRFHQEAQALARLHHPNVTSVFSFFDVADQLYLVMELVEGESLQKRLRRQGPLDWREAVELAVTALDGLAHAHANGIVHRDIKPSNLMLKPGGGLKLMDFGISHVLGQSRMTREGSVVGTLAYMAPEQITRREVDPRTDLYALGIVLYEMVTGRVPFRAESDYELMRAQVEKAPDPPRDHLPGLPAWLELRIVRALAKDPAQRPRSADQLAEELRQGLAGRLGNDETLALDPTLAMPVGAPVLRSADAPVATAPPTRATGPAGSSTGETLPPLPDGLENLAPLPATRTTPQGRTKLVFGGLAVFLLAGALLLWVVSSWPGGEPGGEPAAGGMPSIESPASPEEQTQGASAAPGVDDEGPGGTLPSRDDAADDPPRRRRPEGTTTVKKTRQAEGSDVPTPPAPPREGPLHAHKGPSPGAIPPSAQPSDMTDERLGDVDPGRDPAPSRRVDEDRLLLDVGTIARALPDALEDFCATWEERIEQVEDQEGRALNKADRQLEDQLELLLDEIVGLRRAFNVVASREGLIEGEGMLGRIRRLGSATRATVWERAETALASGRRTSELVGLAGATNSELRTHWSAIQRQLYELEALARQAER